MKKMMLVLLVFLSTWHGSGSSAEPVQSGSVEKVDSRGGFVPIYTVWQKDAIATVVLYSGGGGGFGKIGDDGWPSSRNFLIRSAKMFAAYPFNLVLVGRASDGAELDGAARISDGHDQDNQAIFRALKAKSAAPIWLVGTSMGTISATAAAIRDGGASVAGIVLTSSVTSYRVNGAVPTQELDKIRVPVLVLHHERDACKVCTPYEAKNIAERLKNAPIKKTILVEGGTDPTGGPCEALHYHGYIGIEQKVVGLISGWIRNPEN